MEEAELRSRFWSDSFDFLTLARQEVTRLGKQVRALLDDASTQWNEDEQRSEHFSHVRNFSGYWDLAYDDVCGSLPHLELPIAAFTPPNVPESKKGDPEAERWWKETRQQVSQFLTVTQRGSSDSIGYRSVQSARWELAYGESLAVERLLERETQKRDRLRTLVDIALPFRLDGPASLGIGRAGSLYLDGYDIECIGFCRVALERLLVERGGPSLRRAGQDAGDCSLDLALLIDTVLTPKYLTGRSERDCELLRREAHAIRKDGNRIVHTADQLVRSTALATLRRLSLVCFALYPALPTRYWDDSRSTADVMQDLIESALPYAREDTADE